MDGYGKEFGPDGNGGCILDSDASDGIGRYPQFHGKFAESQVDGKYDSYTSQWLRDMWAMYNATNTTITTNTNTN